MRSTLLRFHRPWTDEREVEGVTGVLSSGELAMGAKTLQFERAFAEYVGATHAVAVGSSAVGLQLALEVVGVLPGDEVITSVYAYGTTAAVIVQLGASPVPVDVLPDSLSIDASLIEAKITPRTRAIVPIHFGGAPCAMDVILAVAARHRLRVVEDAGHALPARSQGRMVGSIGDATVFDFSAVRTMTTGEGGMITTDHADSAAWLRSRRSHGVVPAGDCLGADPFIADTGYRMSDINAAVGLEQLRKVGKFHGIRTYYATLYSHGLGDLPELKLPEPRAGDQHAWHLYTIRLQRERLRIDRDAFIALLREQNIEAGVEFVPFVVRPYYRRRFGYRLDTFPAALKAYERAISLPLYPRMREADVWDVIHAVRAIVERHRTRTSPHR